MAEFNRQDNHLIKSSEEFSASDKIHLSRLLKARSYHVVPELIYEVSTVNPHALLMATRANYLLSMMASYLERQSVAFVKLKWERDTEYDSDFLGENPKSILSDTDLNFLDGIKSTSAFLQVSTAIVHAYILKNHPEEANIILNDKTRFNPACWESFLSRTNQNLRVFGYEYMQEIGEYFFHSDAHDFKWQDVKISEKDFFEHISAIHTNTDKINFAIDQGVALINYLNYMNCFAEIVGESEKGAFMDEQDANEIWLHLSKPVSTPPKEEEPMVINRYNNAIYREAKYDLGVKLPVMCKIGHYILDNHKGLHVYEFILHRCASLDSGFKSALNGLLKNEKSIMYKGKTLEKWKLLAKDRNTFWKHRQLVYRWYQKRINIVTDDECRRALKYLLKNFERYEIKKKDIDEFVADQTLVKRCIESQKPLPDTSEVRDKMELIKKVSPELEKYGLKIVPIDEDEPEKKDTKPKPVTNLTVQNLTPTWEKLQKIWELPIPSQKNKFPDVGVLDKFLQVPRTSLKISKAGKKKTKPTLVSEEESYVGKFNYNELLKKHEGTRIFKDYVRDLGGKTQCVGADIYNATNAEKSIYTTEEEDLLKRGEIPKDKTKVKRGYAQSKGNEFCKENGIEPCHGGELLDRHKAMAETFKTAYNSVHQPKIKRVADQIAVSEGLADKVGDEYEIRQPNINSPEMQKALKKFSDDAEKKKGSDLEKAFTTHLKKFIDDDEQVKKWKTKVDELEGTIRPKKGCKYSTEKVALILCENHNEGQ
jgi:hypothetical protein